MECPHSEAYQSFISDSRLCNVFIAQGSFLSHGHTLGDLLLHECIYKERWRVFQDEDHRQMFWSICTSMCLRERERESGLVKDKKLKQQRMIFKAIYISCPSSHKLNSEFFDGR